MYGNLREIIDEKLKTGDYKMKVKDSGFGCMPIFRFTFKIKRFHYIRVDFSTFVLKKDRIINIDTPEYFTVRAGLSSECPSISNISFHANQMKTLIVQSVHNEWDDYDTVKNGRIKIIIDKLYNIWKGNGN